jgi:hypothetical protein
MTQEPENPTSGGSFIRDPKTGALARVEDAAPAQKARERKPAPVSAEPDQSASESASPEPKE